MQLERIVAPMVEPLSLAEVKIFLRLVLDDEDAMLQGLIRCAREAAEEYLRRSLIHQQWRYLRRGAVSDGVELPMGPVVSVSQVVAHYRDGTEALQSSDTYRLAADGQRLLLDTAIMADGLEVRYLAGFGASAEDIPMPIRQGMLLHVQTMYEGRESGNNRWALYQGLYAPYRMLRV